MPAVTLTYEGEEARTSHCLGQDREAPDETTSIISSNTVTDVLQVNTHWSIGWAALKRALVD